MSEGVTFFRCILCSSVVSPWDVRAGGCPNCGGKRIKPANLSFWEMTVQIIKHPVLLTSKRDEHEIVPVQQKAAKRPKRKKRRNPDAV